MSGLAAGMVVLAADPSPRPSDGGLRPGLEEWQVSPGLIGFVVTFLLAVACVLLFLNMSKHLRQTGYNARAQGLPVAVPDSIEVRRPDADDDGSAGSTPDGSTPDGSAPESAEPAGGSPDDDRLAAPESVSTPDAPGTSSGGGPGGARG